MPITSKVTPAESEVAFRTLIELARICRAAGYPCWPFEHLPKHALTIKQKSLFTSAVKLLDEWEAEDPLVRSRARVIASANAELARRPVVGVFTVLMCDRGDFFLFDPTTTKCPRCESETLKSVKIGERQYRTLMNRFAPRSHTHT